MTPRTALQVSKDHSSPFYIIHLTKLSVTTVTAIADVALDEVVAISNIGIEAVPEMAIGTILTIPAAPPAVLAADERGNLQSPPLIQQPSQLRSDDISIGSTGQMAGGEGLLARSAQKVSKVGPPYQNTIC